MVDGLNTVVAAADELIASCDVDDLYRRAVELAPEFGARAIALKVAGAFHSPFMASAAEELGRALADTAVTRPRVPVVEARVA